MGRATEEERPVIRSWRRHARRSFWFLVFGCLNLVWAIHLGIWWLIVVNVGTVSLLTWTVFTALKWYHAFREGGERLQHAIEELFKGE